MARARCSGVMEVPTKVSGNTTRLVVKVPSNMHREISILATGQTTSQMDLAYTRLQKEPSMKASGRMISSMVTA